MPWRRFLRKPCLQIWASIIWACHSRSKWRSKEISPAAIFALSILFVFLILAALYESWTLPFSVLLSTPVAVFGAFAALMGREMVFNVYAQIGLIVLIGLAAKNAILIVEFAKSEDEGGKDLMDAALSGARLRLRPILMTSFAFILGCVPLAIASGAGAMARQVMGTAVIGGMLAAPGSRSSSSRCCFTSSKRSGNQGGGASRKGNHRAWNTELYSWRKIATRMAFG